MCHIFLFLSFFHLKIRPCVHLMLHRETKLHAMVHDLYFSWIGTHINNNRIGLNIAGCVDGSRKKSYCDVFFRFVDSMRKVGKGFKICRWPMHCVACKVVYWMYLHFKMIYVALLRYVYSILNSLVLNGK